MAMAETEPVVEKRCGQNCETIGRRRAGENFAPDKSGKGKADGQRFAQMTKRCRI